MPTRKPKYRKIKPRRKQTLELLTAKSDQIVWEALKAMRDRGIPFDTQPPLSVIAETVTRLGYEALDNKMISKSLGRLEQKRWIRRPLELIAA